MAITSDPFVVGDRYEVGEVIGRGGMGEVRRAHDRRLRRDVAIKFLRPDLAAQPEARQRFEDEARNAARLTHPNVVLVFDNGEHEGHPYLVMECLPGHTLRDEIKAGALPDERVEWIARDVLGALAAAHAIGIVHRDVSPANILITDSGRAKLADFGISKTQDDPTVTQVGHVIGTPAYLSPERLQGAAATPAADIYSLGVTLVEAVTGSRPSGDTPLPPLPAEVAQALSPDPEQRPTADEWLATYDETRLLGQATTVLPVAGAAAAAGVAAGAGPFEQTMAQPLGASSRVWWHDRRVLAMMTVAVVGLLSLLATTNDSGNTVNTSDSSVVPSTTVTLTVPTTAPPPPPPTTVAPAPSASIEERIEDEVRRRSKGERKRDKDND